MAQPLRLLVTGAGAPGIRGTLYALRRNEDGRAVHVVGTDVRPEAVGRHLCDAFHAVPPPESPRYLGALLALCRREDVAAVLPQTTREVAVLAREREAFEAEGIRVVAAPAEAVEAGNDKAAVLRAFEALGLPVPAYRRAQSEADLAQAAAELGYPERPVVVKPPVSNGMRGLRVLREAAWDAERFLAEKPSGLEISLEELLRILRRGTAWPELLVTDYLPGPEYSVDAFLGEHLEAALPRRRDAIRSGIAFETTLLPERDDLAEMALTAGRHLGLRYAFGFQFKEDEAGRPRVLECNPRVQGTMVASLFGGLNAVWLAVREALGEPPRALPGPLRAAAFRRFWGGLALTETGTHEI